MKRSKSTAGLGGAIGASKRGSSIKNANKDRGQSNSNLR